MSAQELHQAVQQFTDAEWANLMAHVEEPKSNKRFCGRSSRRKLVEIAAPAQIVQPHPSGYDGIYGPEDAGITLTPVGEDIDVFGLPPIPNFGKDGALSHSKKWKRIPGWTKLQIMFDKYATNEAKNAERAEQYRQLKEWVRAKASHDDRKRQQNAAALAVHAEPV